MRILPLLFIGVTLAAEPSFVGVTVDGQKTWFALTNSREGSSRWLSVGEATEGYVIRGYLPQSETLVVERAGVRSLLHLRSSRVRGAVSASDRMFATARREIAARDGWSSDVRLEEAAPREGDYRIIASKENSPEARLITLSSEGMVKDYQKI